MRYIVHIEHPRSPEETIVMVTPNSASWDNLSPEQAKARVNDMISDFKDKYPRWTTGQMRSWLEVYWCFERCAGEIHTTGVSENPFT